DFRCSVFRFEINVAQAFLPVLLSEKKSIQDKPEYLCYMTAPDGRADQDILGRMKTRMERRDFARAILTSAFSVAAAAQTQPRRTARPWPPGIKISVQMPTDPSDEDLQFVNQLGCRYVNIPTSGERATYENFVRLKNKVETAGLKVWNIGNSDVHNMEAVSLNLPGRDSEFEE